MCLTCDHKLASQFSLLHDVCAKVKDNEKIQQIKQETLLKPRVESPESMKAVRLLCLVTLIALMMSQH